MTTYSRSELQKKKTKKPKSSATPTFKETEIDLHCEGKETSKQLHFAKTYCDLT